MTAVYIIAGVLAILAALLMVRVGVKAKYDEDGAEAFILLAGLSIRVYPRPKAAKEKPEKAKKEKPAGEKKKGGSFKAVRDIWGTIKESLERLRLKLRVDELTIHFTAAGADPAKTAMLYGGTSAALGMAVSFLEHKLNIKKYDFGTGFDFTANEPAIYISFRITLRVWHMIYIAIGPIQYFLKQRKRKEEK